MPVYNGERFVSEALESLLSQSFEMFEIILINDGSEDSTACICQQQEACDSRIRYVEKENEGVARTRNRALDMVRGEYVMFVDADDLIYSNSLQLIVNKLRETQTDMLRFEFKTIDEDGKDLYPNYETKFRKKYSNKIMSASEFMNKIMRMEYQLCFHVFKSRILKKYTIRFLDGCTYNEDTLFLLQYFCRSITHVYISDVVYGYRKYSNAVTNTFTERNFNDVMDVFERIMCLLPEDNKLYKAIKGVGEKLGMTLYQYSFVYGNKTNREKIVSYCTHHPVRIEWKTFGVLNVSLWKFIEIYKKIERRFY